MYCCVAANPVYTQVFGCTARLHFCIPGSTTGFIEVLKLCMEKVSYVATEDLS